MIAAFMQLRNELSNGNLIRTLDNTKKWAGEIFIYDDCSTDGSYDAYLNYTTPDNIIRGTTRNFNNEIDNKDKLLKLALKKCPSWIVWQDGDAILDAQLTNKLPSILNHLATKGYDGASIHYMNLWRHPAFYRLDNLFNGLRINAFWRNNGKLSYSVSSGLHKLQHPNGMNHIFSIPESNQILHYGFASEEAIVRKYLTYKSYGQKGWDLDRLIDEQTSFQLMKVPKSLYPVDYIPSDYDTVQMPQPLTYDQYKQYKSYEEYIGVK